MTELILSSNQVSNNFELNFARYLQEIQKFPILEKEEEYNLALKVLNFNDKEAAKILIQSHLRLVAKMAFQFKKYGLALADLVSEGNLGLMQAVKKFDPVKGFRFSTYAMLWIKAYMQDYILRSWSLVKIGIFEVFLTKLAKSKDLSTNQPYKLLAPIINYSLSEAKEVAKLTTRLAEIAINMAKIP